MEILTDETYYKQLRRQDSSGKPIIGTHSYDILANPAYCEAFSYVSCDWGDKRVALIIDGDNDPTNDEAQSDLIRLVLNLGFLKKENCDDFTFESAQIRKKAERFVVEQFIGTHVQRHKTLLGSGLLELSGID